MLLSSLSLGDRRGGGWRANSPLHPVRNLGWQNGKCKNSGKQPGMWRLWRQTKNCLSDSSTQTPVEKIPSSVGFWNLNTFAPESTWLSKRTFEDSSFLHFFSETMQKTCTISPPWHWPWTSRRRASPQPTAVCDRTSGWWRWACGTRRTSRSSGLRTTRGWRGKEGRHKLTRPWRKASFWT